MKVYIDSSLVKSESVREIIGVNEVDIWIGELVHNTGNILYGSIDEIRVSDAARSWNWIKTSYNNQIDPDKFYELGCEEVAPIISIVIQVLFRVRMVIQDMVYGLIVQIVNLLFRLARLMLLLN